jgi:hypothetical protein
MAAVIAASVLTGPHPAFPPDSEKGRKMVADSKSSVTPKPLPVSPKCNRF